VGMQACLHAVQVAWNGSSWSMRARVRVLHACSKHAAAFAMPIARAVAKVAASGVAKEVEGPPGVGDPCMHACVTIMIQTRVSNKIHREVLAPVLYN
jgi:hypothetical protein